jgi:small subunit ribosomal protein S18
MARNNDRDRGAPKRGPKPNDRRPAKKKPSPIVEGTYVDYKDIVLLRKFMSDRGKIKARRVTGLSVQVQRDIAVAIKTARELALLPYATRTTSERGPRRGPRRDKDAGPAADAGDATDNDVSADEVDTEDVEV